MSDESIFAAALSKAPGAERRAFLDGACGGDHDLRRRIERLLEADDQTAGILERGPDAGPTDALGQDGPPLLPERVFAGRFKLRQKLGEGGMGEVWVADQAAPVQRRVAIKVVRPGLDSERMLARFDQERQALALMDHPNIAKVLDAGEADGRPYFVMELIKGVPITEYCDRAKLSPRERLALFVPVCEAVQHAHQKGVVHRDLKPSNILVALYDGRPVPKVIDFGIAKATGPRLTDRSIYTEVGALVGTLEYMVPEQAELNNLDIDTRADVYALGAILYELLTGSVPFSRQELQAAGFLEMLRVIREVEPPRPSTKLSKSGTLPSVADVRRTDPQKLVSLMRGELDWIILKCLEKDRGRRYQAASGLARDLEHYLADEPVEACPPTAGYRLRKFARKYRTPMLVAGAFVLLWSWARSSAPGRPSAPPRPSRCARRARPSPGSRKHEAGRRQGTGRAASGRAGGRQRQPPPGQLRRRHEPGPRRLGREQPEPRPRAAGETPAPARRDRPARLRMALPSPSLSERSADREGACRRGHGRRLHAGRQAAGHVRIEPPTADDVRPEARRGEALGCGDRPAASLPAQRPRRQSGQSGPQPRRHPSRRDSFESSTVLVWDLATGGLVTLEGPATADRRRCGFQSRRQATGLHVQPR